MAQKSLNQPMHTSYYSVLSLQNNAKPLQICHAYRDLALKYHPSLHHENVNAAYHKFCQASEAFDVLFDPEKRKVYDEGGERVLKESINGKYKWTSDPMEIFQKFFGSRNVYEHLLSYKNAGDTSHPIFAAQYPHQGKSHPPAPLIVSVPCTLTELFNGCSKQLQYKKKVLTSDGKNVEEVLEKKKIVIQPGMGKDKNLQYPGQGNTQPGHPPSKLVFKLVEQPQKNYTRHGSTLVYTHHLSLLSALTSESVTITQLNGELLQLRFDEVITPQTKRVIPEKGMPDGHGKRGVLEVKFDIEFPQELQYSKKERIVQILSAQAA